MRELERVVAGLVERSELRYFGKYRATVAHNEDPARLGRLKLRVPSVLGPDAVTGWATPCLPYGGAMGRGFFFVPERESGVWAEFEEGDLEFPVWTGTYWVKQPGKGSQAPHPAQADGTPGDAVQNPPTRKILTTLAGHTLQFEDAEGEETVLLREGRKGHRIRLDAEGVTVTDHSGNAVRLDKDGITLTAAGGLTVNAAGKKVTVVCDSFDIRKG